MKKLLCIVLFLAMFTGMLPTYADAASAVNYPTRPITLIVPFTTGSGDSAARMFARYLEKYLGQPIIPTNMPGGSGGVGLQHAMQAAPDGYTICFMSSTIAYGMAHGNIRYNPRDLNPICSFNSEALGIFVPKDSPFNTIEDFINYAKQHPGELVVGGTAIASAQHSFFITLLNEAGIDIEDIHYVPYGGSDETVLAFIGGNHDAGVFAPNSIRQYMETEGVRCLLYGAIEHDDEFEGVPIGKDVGFPKIDDLLQFRAFLTTPGVPEEIMQILEEASEKAFNDPEYQQYLIDMRFTPFYKNRKDYADFLATFVENAEAVFAQMDR